MRNGHPHGKGEFIHLDGSKYEGGFVKGHMESKNGKLTR